MVYFSVEGRSRHDVLSPGVAGGAARGTKRPRLLEIMHGRSYLKRRSRVGGQVSSGALVLGAPALSSVRQSMRSQARISKLGTWLTKAVAIRRSWVHGGKHQCGSC